MDLASTNFLMTPIIGGVVGWLASILMRTNAQMGILANVIVGVFGSFLGVAVANGLGVRAQTTPAAWIVAVLGAALLIALLRALGVFKQVGLGALGLPFDVPSPHARLPTGRSVRGTRGVGPGRGGRPGSLKKLVFLDGQSAVLYRSKPPTSTRWTRWSGWHARPTTSPTPTNIARKIT